VFLYGCCILLCRSHGGTAYLLCDAP
jgi:hypothetical protein